LVDEMLRTRFAQPSDTLIERVREGWKCRGDPVFYFIGCYGGFLYTDAEKKAVRQNEVDCLRKAKVLLTKSTKRVSNFKQAVLLLTHGAMYKTWWKTCNEPLLPGYRTALERVRRCLALSKSNLEKTDLCLEVMLCLGEEPDRGECVRLLHGFEAMNPTVPRAHVGMLLRHFCDQDGMVTDMNLLDAVAVRRPPNSTGTFEFPTDSFNGAFRDRIDRLRTHVLEEVLHIHAYDVVPGMSYVRIKDTVGSFTELHSDYENVVNVRKAVLAEDAGLVRTIWVALHDIDDTMSSIQFPRRPTRSRIKKGEVFVFGLNEEHYATTHRSTRRVRFSVDFRVRLIQ